MNANTITSLLWFIGIGALFYFMMRAGGCGAHQHGGAGRHQHGSREGGDTHAMSGGPSAGATSVPSHEPAGVPPVDPVCGMPVMSTSPALQRSYMGRTFSFCSQDCLRKFEADPLSYARAQATAEHRHGARPC